MKKTLLASFLTLALSGFAVQTTLAQTDAYAYFTPSSGSVAYASAIDLNSSALQTNSDGEKSYKYYLKSDCSDAGTDGYPKNVGTYYITVSIAATANYTAVDSKNNQDQSQYPGIYTLEITKANLSVSWPPNGNKYSTTYGTPFDEADFKPQTNSDGAKSYKYYTNQACTEGETADQPTDAKTYYVKVTTAETSNCHTATSTGSATFTIEKVKPTVTFSQATYSYTYGGTAPTVSATAASTSSEGTSLSSDGNITYAYYTDALCTKPYNENDPSIAPTVVGTYYVSAMVSVGTNHLASSASTTYTITRATPTVTFNETTPYTKTYGADAITISAKSTSGETPTITYYTDQACTTGATTTQPTDANTYYVKATVAANANYTEGSSEVVTFTISKATPTVTFEGTTPYSKTYGEAAVSISATSTSSVTPTITYYTDDQYTEGATTTQPTDANTYYVKATVAENDNYKAGEATTTFTISKATPTVTFSPASYEITYGDEAASITATATSSVYDGTTATSDGAISYLYYTDEACSENETSTQPSNASATPYYIKATVSEGTNHISASSTTPATLTIKKSDKQTVTFKEASYSKTYGEAEVSIEAEASSGVGTITYRYYTDQACTEGETSTQPTAAGTYYVKATVSESDNYLSKTSDAVAFTIEKATPTVTFSEATYSYTYGGTAPTVSATAASTSSTSESLPSDGAITYMYYTDELCTQGETADQPTTGGTYYVKATVAEGTNHKTASNSTSFTINQATPTFTFDKTAYEKVYGAAEVAISVTSTSDATSITIQYYKDADCQTLVDADNPTAQPTAVGEYFLQASVAETQNYEAATSDAISFNVIKATPTVSFAETAYSITYGDEVLTISPTVSPESEATRVKYEYYKEATCENLVDAANPSAQPTTGGTYYLKATLEANESYNAASAVVPFTVNSQDVTIKMDSEIGYSGTYGTAVTVGAYVYDANSNVIPEENRGTVSFTYYNDEACTELCDQDNPNTQPICTGDYFVKASVAATANYKEATSESGVLLRIGDDPALAFAMSASAATYCDGSDGVTITLAGSKEGASYILQKDNAEEARKTGTGEALTFEKLLSGTYKINALYTDGCGQTMNMGPESYAEEITISEAALPTQFELSASAAAYCEDVDGVTLTIGGSQTDISYEIQQQTTNPETQETSYTPYGTLPGTGEALTQANVPAGTYRVVATSPEGCTSTMTTQNADGTITITENALPAVYELVVPEVTSYCSNDGGLPLKLSGSAEGVNYTVYNAEGEAAGTAVAGTGAELELGNYPAGTYKAKAAVAETGCSADMTGSATFTELPSPATFTLAEVDSLRYCAVEGGVTLRLSGSETGITYYLFNNKDYDAETEAYLDTFAVAEGTGAELLFEKCVAGVYTLIAANGENGCSTQMDGNPEVILKPNTATPTVLAYDACYKDGLVSINLRDHVTSSPENLRFYDASGNLMEEPPMFDISRPWIDSVAYVTNTIDPACESSRATIRVYVEGMIEAELNLSTYKVAVGGSVTLYPDVYEGVVTEYLFTANGQNIKAGSDFPSEFSHMPMNDVTYKMILTGRCNVTESSKAVSVRWQTAITPYDKNGKNDVFAKGMEIHVYNTQGQVVYEGSDGWDGTANGNFAKAGELVQPGTYYYYCKNEDGSVRKGTIEVVKR